MSHFDMKLGDLILSLYVLLAASIALAESPRTPAAISNHAIEEASLNLSPELIKDYEVVKQREKNFDPGQVVPLDMKPTDDSGEVFSRIADYSLSNFFNSAAVKSSPLGKTADRVEKKVKQDIVINDSENHVQHKVSFQLQAFQEQAKIDYTGYLNASLKYHAPDSATIFEIQEPLAKNKEVYVNHTATPSDRLSEVGMRWSF